jgi:hypothetical protein
VSCIQGRTLTARKGRLGFRGVTPSPAQKTAGPAQTPSFAPGPAASRWPPRKPCPTRRSRSPGSITVWAGTARDHATDDTLTRRRRVTSHCAACCRCQSAPAIPALALDREIVAFPPVGEPAGKARQLLQPLDRRFHVDSLQPPRMRRIWLSRSDVKSRPGPRSTFQADI